MLTLKRLVFLLCCLIGSAGLEAQSEPAPEVSTHRSASNSTQEALLQAWENAQDLLSAEAGFGFRYGEMFWSLVIIIVTLMVRRLAAHLVFASLKKFVGKTKVTWDDKVLAVLEAPMIYFVVLLGFFMAFLQLHLKPTVHDYAVNTFQAIAIGIIFWGIIRLTDVLTEVLGEVTRRKGHSIGTFMPLINRAMRVFLVMLAGAIILQSFNVPIGSVLGALGIGGAAFAFAAKDTIANIYGSFALALDRPFKVGDWIMVGDQVDGDVEEIGLRSTKVRTWPKTVISIPNHVLANEYINNWSRMPKRRVKQIVGVTYDSTPDDMEGLVEDIRQLLREDDDVQQDFILVNFIDFGASSLDILVYYFTTTTQWLGHMDVRQRINVKIMRAVRARGMSVAFPTRTLHLDGEVARKMAGMDLPGDHGPTMPQ